LYGTAQHEIAREQGTLVGLAREVRSFPGCAQN